MVDRQTRVKKRKFRRTPGGKTVIHYSRGKKSYAECAVTGEKLHGMGNQEKSAVRKQAKSARRPSAQFGGVLSGRARKELWENVGLVMAQKKEVGQIPVRFRKFVSEKMARVQ